MKHHASKSPTRLGKELALRLYDCEMFCLGLMLSDAESVGKERKLELNLDIWPVNLTFWGGWDQGTHSTILTTWPKEVQLLLNS